MLGVLESESFVILRLGDFWNDIIVLDDLGEVSFGTVMLGVHVGNVMSLVILQLGDFWSIRIVLGELGDVSFDFH